MLNTEISKLIYNGTDDCIILENGERLYHHSQGYYYSRYGYNRMNYLGLENCDFIIKYKPADKIGTSLDINENQSIDDMINNVLSR